MRENRKSMDVEEERFSKKPFDYFSKLVNAPRSARLPTELYGPTPPSIFVGRYGYPKVFVGPLVSFQEGENSELSDNPAHWHGLDLNTIMKFRSSLVRGKQVTTIKPSGRLVEDLQDVTLSKDSVDVEVEFKKPPSMEWEYSTMHQPMGPSGVMQNMRVVGNPKIPGKAEELSSEKIKVREAVPELLESGLDYYYLQKLLSAGLLGEEKKLVPTRWSITATDRIIADTYLEQIKQYPEVNECLVFSDTYMFNHFEILLIPGKFEFEQFESWEPRSNWNLKGKKVEIAHEYEPFQGRSDYAETEGGGYYSGRLGVVEGLYYQRKQAKCIVFREIGQYEVPLGCWVIRESVRSAMKKTPIRFNTMNEALNYLSTRLKWPISTYKKKSQILQQRKLLDF